MNLSDRALGKPGDKVVVRVNCGCFPIVLIALAIFGFLHLVGAIS